eukprot:GHRR01007285.1.p1 GENE.GHRR01007285.1~~GHRR01007285.1.p1  ORF type:complete len:862 (+),score=270.91 GHRR01007285.1:709-3294(+)
MVVGSDNATVITENVIRVKGICQQPGQQNLASALTYPVLPGYPPNKVAIVDGLCVPNIHNGQSQLCFNEGLKINSLATAETQSNVEGSGFDEGYTLVQRNVTRVCQSYLDPDCLRQHYPDYCWAKAAVSVQDKPSTALSAGAIAGIVVAGVAALLGLLVCCWYRKNILHVCLAAVEDPSGELQNQIHQHVSQDSYSLGEYNMLPGKAEAQIPQQIKLGVLLGTGSFGRVYSGRWHGSDVAVKVMSCRPSELVKVLQEAEIMMSLDHRNIVRALNCSVVRTSSNAEALANTASHTTSSGRSLNAKSISTSTATPHTPAVVAKPPSGLRSPGRISIEMANARSAADHIGPRPSWLNPGFSTAANVMNQSQTANWRTGTQPENISGLGALSSGGGTAAAPMAAAATGTTTPDRLTGSGSASNWQLRHPVSAQGHSSGTGTGQQLNDSNRSRGSTGACMLRNITALLPVGSTGHCSSACNAYGSGDDDASNSVQRQQQQQSGSRRSDVEAHLSPTSTELEVLDVWGSSTGREAETKERDDVEVWLVLELCGGGNLKDSAPMKTRDKQSMAVLLCRLDEVASGMAYLHLKGVLHGDLKAANVLLQNSIHGSYGQIAKLSDFGLAAVLLEGATHRSTQRTGTITHTAPEVLGSGHLSPAADVYSFGIMMWELYTNSSAYQNMHYGAVVERVVLRGERPHLPPDAPDEYNMLMSMCWAADPKDRPDFSQVAKCLEIMLENMNQLDEAVMQDEWQQIDSKAALSRSGESTAAAELPNFGGDGIIGKMPANGSSSERWALVTGAQAGGLSSVIGAGGPLTPQQGTGQPVNPASVQEDSHQAQNAPATAADPPRRERLQRRVSTSEHVQDL